LEHWCAQHLPPFVDDTLIFYGAIPVHLLYLHALLLSFEAVSNLKINIAESELVCVGNVNNVDGLASILGCEFSSLPLKYLGLTLGAFFKAKSIWNSVIEKIKCHLASWKMYLSKVEGLPLLRAPYPICLLILSLFPFPASVANCKEKLQLTFL
jgi:hypothetical protein